MKKLSIKLKVTLWHTVFMVALTVFFIAVLIISSNKMTESILRMRLTNAVEWASKSVNYDDKGIKISPDFGKSKGIDVVIYDTESNVCFSKKNSILIDATYVEFKDRHLQIIEENGTKYYVYDYFINFKRHDDLWARGIIPVSSENIASASMIKLTLIIFPFIALFTAIGGYFITKRAFAPVSKITSAANEISGGKDLSKRISIYGDNLANDEISVLAETFDKMFERLQKSFENERQFTCDASHELRTPTAVIISQCEYLLSQEDNEDKTASLKVILRQSKKMSKLISELLMLARTDNNKQAVHFERLNLSETIQIVIEEMDLVAHNKNIKFKTDISDDIYINADQTLIMRMLINLMSNAVQYANQDGLVKISLHRVNGNVQGKIADNGIGIAPEYLDKIWDRFFQVDPSRNNTNGSSGLGLAMVKWIVEKHNGTIVVESTINEGTVFTFILPEAK
ncbi:sensor histidine kinase [Anaerotignum sp.]|uniref:sensor histidine kinase n=1 Tax=Anaerotignum sp. TaxID=2039241 RepID=UPI0027151ECD|nr:HAMP domain-containing sensor histidine kinase [Anaerotignum sp.]